MFNGGMYQREMEREKWSRRTGSSPGSFIYGRRGRRCSRTTATTTFGVRDGGLDWHDWELPDRCASMERIMRRR
jgi:hypothetical protein